MGTRLGKLIKVKNKKKVSHLASEFYHSTWIKLHDGRVVPVLFTDNEIEDALERAGRNPEDIVGRSIASLILD